MQADDDLFHNFNFVSQVDYFFLQTSWYHIQMHKTVMVVGMLCIISAFGLDIDVLKTVSPELSAPCPIHPPFIVLHLFKSTLYHSVWNSKLPNTAADR